MKKILNILTLAVAALAFTSCDDLFEPAIENNLGLDYMYNNAGYAEGVLANAYTRIPCSSYPFSEVGTDDAVSNDPTNSYRKITAGSWTSDNNPTERWRDCRAGITYVNLFLSKADKVHWADDEVAAGMFKDREMGEAYGMRAMFMYYLLQAHGGYDAQGNLLGVPIVTVAEDVNSEFNVPRNTFAECMKAIYDDCQKALELLPTKYVTITSDAQIPVKYKGASMGQYNRVFGSTFNGRMDGSIVEAFRSKAALLAASPAFQASGVKWEDAANYAAQVLDRIGGVSGMDAQGWTWYSNTKEIDGLTDGACPKEILWRGIKGSSNDLETNNYPPSLYGKALINPTQNFVDAFPDKNGYPITDPNTIYKDTLPYANRDPRLSAYVVFNGGKVGVSNTVINTTADATDAKDNTKPNKDGINHFSGSSTRTGYYLRKLLRQDVNLEPTATTKQMHYTPRIRFTEIFLNYAEAANEAWGPSGNGGHGYSAYDIIAALHNRAGVGNGYLESIKTDKDKMRQLIRNERRIELSFEGFRFWDLRRWNAPLTEKAMGMSINSTNKTYSPVDVETRDYKDYMNYGPIPYTEVLKYNQLQQNKGWESK